MLSPSNEDRICAMFDSFCKTVSRNFVRNLDRAEGNRDKHFSDEPVDYLLETLGRRDEYPSESFVLYVGGSSCAVESETLYKALLSLTEKQRNVLLLDFWGDLSDQEISEKMEVTPRTVYNLRQRSFSKIREFYEKRGREKSRYFDIRAIYPSKFKKQVIDFNEERNPGKTADYLHVENEFVCFYTGLYTRRYKAVYGCFDRNKRQASMLDWYFRGFSDELSPWLKYIRRDHVPYECGRGRALRICRRPPSD